MTDRDPDAGILIRTGWNDDDWDRAAAASPEAAYFHTRAWARIVLASFPALRDRSLWFDTPAGPALFPLFAWSRLGGMMTTLHSTFPFLYGGPVGPGIRCVDDVLRRVVGHCGRLSSLRLHGNPFADRTPRALPVTDGAHGDASAGRAHIPGLTTGEDHTNCMPVPATEEEYWESVLEARRRNDIRRLLRKGVVVEESRDPADMATVYGFYLESFERWGGRPAMVYPPAFYRNLINLGGQESRFLIARFEGRILGGSYFVSWNGKTHYLAGYFDHDARALSPLALIQVGAVGRAILEKDLIYDFLPSGGHQAVEAFKQGLGGKPVAFPVYERTGALHRAAGLLRR